jgi:hypothetical protein
MKIMKKVLGCLSLAALAVVLAAPVSAQTLTLKASVPFDFVLGGHIMPAGDYVFSVPGDFGLLQVRSLAMGIMPVVATTNAIYSQREGSAAFLTFHRYGGDYFLATIWDGAVAGGRSLPMSRIEQERAKSASLRKPEVVVVLARR